MYKTEKAESFFILGDGPNGTFIDIKIEISIDKESSLKILKNTQNQDKQILSKINLEFKNWINQYAKKDINLKITVTHIGIDPTGRLFQSERAVNNIMHEALPKIGVKPPQIFGF